MRHHMNNIRNSEMPRFPNVRFYAVDYVYGRIANARARPAATIGIRISDSGRHPKDGRDSYQATMGITIVIDRAGVVRMNEDYKDGVRLQTVLAGLP